MTIRVICVGRLKERYYGLAQAEYVKRLSRYATVEIVEVADEKAPETLSAAQRTAVMDAEGARILSRIGAGDYVTALCIDGASLSSTALAKRLCGLMTEGKSRLTFVIGGSLGLGAEVLSRADARLSFSAMTFPHQLFRIMLLEQLYRSFKISANEPYHK